MNRNQAGRRAYILGGGAVLLLLIILVAPKFAPSASPGSVPDEPSIDASTISSETTGAEGLTGKPTDASDTAADSDGAPSLFSVGILLRVMLVAVVLGAAVFGLRWWNRRTSGPRSTTGFIRVIDTLPINGGRAIHLVEVGDRVIAVGATAQQLSLITELTPVEAHALRDRIEQPADQNLGAFAQQIVQHLRRDDLSHIRRAPMYGEDI